MAHPLLDRRDATRQREAAREHAEPPTAFDLAPLAAELHAVRRALETANRWIPDDYIVVESQLPANAQTTPTEIELNELEGAQRTAIAAVHTPTTQVVWVTLDGAGQRVVAVNGQDRTQPPLTWLPQNTFRLWALGSANVATSTPLTLLLALKGRR